MLDARYVIDEPQIVSEEFDGEYVILNMSNGTYYSLDGGGNALWSAMIDGAKPAAILDRMTGSESRYCSEARVFFEKIIELGLVRVADGSDGAVPPSVDLAEVAKMTAAPAIEIFDDLADLILADPVHDVDEQAGWPIAKNG